MAKLVRTGGVLSRATLSTFGLAVQGFARFAFTIFIGRFVGAEALADVSALLSVSVWMALAMPQGLGVAASRYFSTSDRAGVAAHQLSRWFWLASPILAILTVPIAFWLVGDLVAALTCSVLVFAYNRYVFSRGAMMGEDRVLRATIADALASFATIALLALVLLGNLNWAALLPLALGYGLFSVICKPQTKPEAVSAADRAALIRFVGQTVVGGLAVGGLLPTTMIFVRAFDTPLQAGLFAAALSLATPANMVAQAINQVLLPHFGRVSQDTAAMARAQLKMFLMSASLLAIVFTILIVFAPFILSLFYGEKYVGGMTAMRVLLGVVFVISAMASPSAYLFASGRQRVYATTWLTSLIIGTLIMLGLSPSLGMWGALIGYAVGGGGGALTIILFGSFLSARVLRVRAS